MNELIIGFGQIGKAVKEVICPHAETYDIADSNDVSINHNDIDILHICFPYSETFKRELQGYIGTLKPKHIIVYSTVPIGTCKDIDERIVHSPIEGRHPKLASSIRNSYRWIGFNDGTEGKFFCDYFESRNLKVWFVTSTDTTELVKLRSTAKYGVNLVWAQYDMELCKKYGVPYNEVMSFDVHYNETYIEEPDNNRYIVFPPNGKIGGHCIVPNAKLLNEQLPSDLLEKIIAMEVKE